MIDGKLWDVISSGDFFIDLVMTGFPSLPKLGEEGFCTGMTRETGGGAAHTSSGLAKLGLRSALYCVAGVEEIDWFRHKFSDRGVDTSLVVAHPDQPTAITVAVSTPEDRIFYTYYGANILFAEMLRKTSTWERFTNARHIHLAYPVEPGLLAEMSQWLRSRGTGVSFDLGWHEDWLANPASVRALATLDWFLPNDREAERMSGESEPRRMIEWFRDHGACGVAIKLGPNGSTAFQHSEVASAPSIKVNPIDTTGAGDCFDAGFLYGILTGRSLEESLRYGNLCGALSTEAKGGIDGFPALDRVLQAR